MAESLGVEAHYSDATRLLVEVNRSLHHRRLFSDITSGLPRATKQTILDRWYHPYRDRVTGAIDTAIESGSPVLHLLVHTFTPTLDGNERTADIAVLYDPARPRERETCGRWRAAIVEADPKLRVRRNYPYRGTADGFEVFLRRRHPSDADYVGITLEVNQAWWPSPRWTVVAGLLATTLASTARPVRHVPQDH